MAYISKYSGKEIENAVNTINNFDISQLRDFFYPIGSIYTSTKSASPAILFGGTWVQIKDTFLLTAGDTYNAGATGGAATHTHTTGDHALTVAQMPAHTHTRGTMNITGEWTINSDSNNAGLDAQNTGSGCIIAKNASGGTGSSVAGTNWNVTSGFKFDASQSWTGATSSVGNGATHNHGSTGSASNLPPYRVVYAWERTA